MQLPSYLTKQSTVATIVLLAVVGGFFYYSHISSARFDESLNRYMELARQCDIAAYVPGIEQNSVRQKLNTILVEVLSGSLNSSQRLSRAEEGLLLLDQSEEQLNKITELSDALAIDVAQMALTANSASDLTKKGSMREIVALAKHRAEIISDIRAYSYNANYKIGNIFHRIMADKGALTSTHINDLNKELPAAEEQFDKRANLYEELKLIAQKMEELYTTL